MEKVEGALLDRIKKDGKQQKRTFDIPEGFLCNKCLWRKYCGTCHTKISCLMYKVDYSLQISKKKLKKAF